MGHTGLKSRCRRGCILSGDSRKDSFFAFSSFQRLPAFLGLLPFLSSPELTITSLHPLSPSLLLLLWLSWLSFSPFKDLCDSTELTWIIQDTLPMLRSLTWSHLQSPSCHKRQHICRFWDRPWTLLVDHYSVYHICYSDFILALNQ